jgi:penicillin V acylase-like amidase (Ntn superfamily)
VDVEIWKLVTTVYGLGAADGMNERGLAAHMLYLNAADFGQRNAKLPGVQAGLWEQYALDNSATVDEALDVLMKIQPIAIEAHGHKANVHLALEDAGGDSAIIEYIEGKPLIHHGREFGVMTNDPSYDQQLLLLKGQDSANRRATCRSPATSIPATASSALPIISRWFQPRRANAKASLR